MSRLSRILIAAFMGAIISGCSSGPSANVHREPALGLTSDAASPAQEAAKANAAGLRETMITRTPWTYQDAAGCLISTPNYRVYTTIEYPKILDRLPVFYERALEHYTTALAKLPKPDVPLRTYLFQERSQWQAMTAEMLPDQAGMFNNLGRGGFTTKGTSVLYYIDRWGYSRDTLAIAAHEGWHQYTQETFKHQLPIWLEEGVATYMEGYRSNRDGEPDFMPWANFERRDALKDAIRGKKLIALDELLTRSPQSFLNQSKDSLLTYYAQVWGLTRFLAEGEGGRYKDGLAQVLQDAANGRLIGRMMESSANGRRRGVTLSSRAGPAVVQEYFNCDLKEFEAQYLAYVEEITKSGVPNGPPRSR